MFNFVYSINILLVISLFTLMIFFCANTYLYQNMLTTDLLHLNYTNTEYYWFYNVVYTSVLATLLLIVVLNRSIIKTSAKPVIMFLSFAIVTYVLIYTNSIFIFFMAYEILLILTSTVVYFNSQNIRSKSITIYFIFWTQLSSLILWIAVTYIYSNTGGYLFHQLSLSFCDEGTRTTVKYLLLISFSIKLPLWPFSFWLIKTHVEANTSFSIFLSGVLVKTALVGLIKFNVFFVNTDCTFILTGVILSIMFTTFAINVQVDFKKLIAYTTVQEMSLTVLFTLFSNYSNLNILVYFILLHTFTSILLFLLNDSIYIRFKTRKTKVCLGLATVAPKLNLILICIWVMFISIPLSFKFTLEVVLLWKLISTSFTALVSVLFCLQFLTLVFFSINVLPYSFGNGFKTTSDLTKNENIVYIIVILLLITLIF